MSELKDYLGDSVYADVSDGMIVLTTENGYGASNPIFLDPETMNALIRYRDRITAHFSELKTKSNQ